MTVSSQWGRLSPSSSIRATRQQLPGTHCWSRGSTHKPHDTSTTTINTYTAAQFSHSWKTHILTDCSHRKDIYTRTHTNVQSCTSPEGHSLWKTWGRRGAKDGWRQQLLLPGCRCVPGANPLISALPTHQLLLRGSKHAAPE